MDIEAKTYFILETVNWLSLVLVEITLYSVNT